MTTEQRQLSVTVPTPHDHQAAFIESTSKRKVVRAGRRGGKTVGMAILAVQRFLAGQRVLYAAPTSEQVATFWREVTWALQDCVDAGAFKRNETERYIERVGTEQRIRAKSAWNADTLRGDYADLLILDEWQLCDESAWTDVGAPMLLDRDGDVVFIYTPPSLRSAGVSKAQDPLHAAKLFKSAQADTSGRWATFHFASHDNPFISRDALGEITQDMSRDSYRREILAEDDDESPHRLIYRAFNEATNLIQPFALPATWPRYVGHDFGGANPAALFVAQDPGTGYHYVYDEYRPPPGTSIYQQVIDLKVTVDGLSVLKRIGGSHQEDGVRAAYTAQGWPIAEPKEKMRRVNARIEAVQAIMERGQVFVFNNCHEFVREIRTYLWQVDRDGNITNDIYNQHAYHLMDCMAYIMSDFRPETVRQRSGNVRIPTFW